MYVLFFNANTSKISNMNLNRYCTKHGTLEKSTVLDHLTRVGLYDF